MTENLKFTEKELAEILSNYDLGEYVDSEELTGGTVQTNILLKTAKDKFVFRYYKMNRSKNSVLFEANLTKYLKDRNFPCPAVFANKNGELVGIYSEKSYVIFEFIEGQHLENPNADQQRQLVEKVAELHNITKNYRPSYKKYRWNYNIKLCQELAQNAAEEINTANSRAKLQWLENELSKLILPGTLPRGVCHCDFHFSNILFKNGEFNALIDFDDANYTFLMFDLVGLIEYWAWPRGEEFGFERAREILQEYEKYRKLNSNEKRHLFDLYKLSILFDCIWYFSRGDVKDFFEKRKIDYLDGIGRDSFFSLLFADD